MLSREERARIFLPFDALNGLREALKEKEIEKELEYETKKELSEESYIELEKEFNKMEIGSKIKIIYYKNKRYTELIGRITKINYIKKRIQIDKIENINICDVLKLELFYKI